MPPASFDTSTGMPIRERGEIAAHAPDAARSEATRLFCIEAARSLTDDKCEYVLVLDLRGRSQVTDFFVIASGTSDRQIRSAADHVADMASSRGISLYRSNLDESRANWIVLDFVDVVVHAMLPETRRYYDLELLWGDAPRVAWQRPGDAPSEARPSLPGERNRAGLTERDVLPRADG